MWTKKLRQMLCLIVLVSLAYSFRLNGPFVFDDLPTQYGADPVPLSVHSFLVPGRALSALSYRLDFLGSGANPFRFHLTNLLIHEIAIVFVYLIVFYFVPETAFWATLLVSVHPLFSQSVEYVTARSSTLAAMFMLMAIAAFFYLKSIPRWICVSAASYLACISKEEGVLIIPILILCGLIGRRSYLWLAGWVVVCVSGLSFAVWRFSLFPQILSSTVINDNPSRFIDSVSRFQHIQMVANNFVWHLLPNMIFPFSLSVDPLLYFGNYIRFSISIAVLSLLAACVLWTRLKRVIRFGILFTIASPPLLRFAVMIGDPGFEYRAYLSILGIALFAAVFFKCIHPDVRYIYAIGLTILLMSISSYRHTLWAEPAALWEDAVESNPTPRSLQNLAYSYENARRYKEAIPAYLRVLKLKPESAMTASDLASAYAFDGQFDLAEKYLNRAIAINPRYSDAWANYAQLMIVLNRPEVAIPMAERAVNLSPDSIAAKLALNEATRAIRQAQHHQ